MVSPPAENISAARQGDPPYAFAPASVAKGRLFTDAESGWRTRQRLRLHACGTGALGEGDKQCQLLGASYLIGHHTSAIGAGKWPETSNRRERAVCWQAAHHRRKEGSFTLADEKQSSSPEIFDKNKLFFCDLTGFNRCGDTLPSDDLTRSLRQRGVYFWSFCILLERFCLPRGEAEKQLCTF